MLATHLGHVLEPLGLGDLQHRGAKWDKQAKSCWGGERLPLRHGGKGPHLACG
jgi:hypothetical protein